MEKSYFIGKVYVNKSNSQKLLTIPAKSIIKEGDIVIVKLFKNEDEE